MPKENSILIRVCDNTLDIDAAVITYTMEDLLMWKALINKFAEKKKNATDLAYWVYHDGTPEYISATDLSDIINLDADAQQFVDGNLEILDPDQEGVGYLMASTRTEKFPGYKLLYIDEKWIHWTLHEKYTNAQVETVGINPDWLPDTLF